MRDIQKLSDTALVEIIRNKDKEAFSEIIKRYEQVLLRYATYLLNDPEKATDVVQVSFIKTYINLNSFNAKFKFSSWIYRITHNEAINYINKNKNENPLYENLEIESDVNIEEEYSKNEIIEMIKSCINQIPIMYKVPITLFYLEEKSYTEIGDILRIPVSTVGVRIGRAKALVKKLCLKKIK